MEIAGKSYWRGSLSTVDLLAPTSLDQLFLNWENYLGFFTKQLTLIRRSIVLRLSLWLVVPGDSIEGSGQEESAAQARPRAEVKVKNFVRGWSSKLSPLCLRLSDCQSASMWVSQSVCLSVCLYVTQSVSLSVRLSICLPAYMLVSLL
jgi:hypothetical protein